MLSDCMLWLGAKSKDGYGLIHPKRTSVSRAHRLAYEQAYGPIPEKLWVLHICDTPLCMNPAHLWLGTQFDNQRDAVRKGRSAILRNRKLRKQQAKAGVETE